MYAEDAYFDLKEILYILRRNLLIILAGAAVFALLGYLGALYFLPRRYEADTTFIINAPQDKQVLAANDLKNEALLQCVQSQLGLSVNLSDIMENMKVEQLPSSGIYQLSVQNSNPQYAAALANAIIRNAPSYAPDMLSRIVNPASIIVLQEAQAPKKPVFPDSAVCALAGAAAGMGLSVLFVFLKANIYRRLNTARDIEKYLGYRVIGDIPVYTSKYLYSAGQKR